MVDGVSQQNSCFTLFSVFRKSYLNWYLIRELFMMILLLLVEFFLKDDETTESRIRDIQGR